MENNNTVFHCTLIYSSVCFYCAIAYCFLFLIILYLYKGCDTETLLLPLEFDRVCPGTLSIFAFVC